MHGEILLSPALCLRHKASPRIEERPAGLPAGLPNGLNMGWHHGFAAVSAFTPGASAARYRDRAGVAAQPAGRPGELVCTGMDACGAAPPAALAGYRGHGGDSRRRRMVRLALVQASAAAA